MIYSILKLYAKFAIRIYCPKIIINRPQLLEHKGPILLAANHPNSFLDGMILTTLFRYPVYSLARGDAFKNPKIKKILNWLRLLPVYRTTEGVENLEHNYTTFAQCQKAFEKEAIVLIFSEAASFNEWHLRPLRKGTGRLAVSSWEKGIPVNVLPVALNYSSFKRFGKAVHIYFGEFIKASQIMPEPTHGKQLLLFNKNLHHQLQEYVYEIRPPDKEKIHQLFYFKQPLIKKLFLTLPALVGYVLHVPLFFICKTFTALFFKNSDHYDAVLTSLLVLFYPIYYILFVGLAFLFLPLLSIALVFLLPFCAWALMQMRNI